MLIVNRAFNLIRFEGVNEENNSRCCSKTVSEAADECCGFGTDVCAPLHFSHCLCAAVIFVLDFLISECLQLMLFSVQLQFSFGAKDPVCLAVTGH